MTAACLIVFALFRSSAFSQNMTTLKENFANPPTAYRPVPFWSLNDELNEKEIMRQIKLLKEGGLGGFFIHSRIGLLTPYLSDEWFSRVDVMLREAKKYGLSAWLYDEDRWPSGFAGGKVLEAHPEFRQKLLAVVETQELPDLQQKQLTLAGRLYDARLLKVFLAEKKSSAALASYSDITEETETLQEKKLKPPRAFLLFYRVMPAFHEEWFNGHNYADLLDENAVNAFLENTHEKYKQDAGKFFGNLIPGIFTDEPSYTFVPSNPPNAVPWTSVFPDIFMEKKKYDVMGHLPALFYNTGGDSRYRYDFWSALTERFVENYTKRLYAWCDKNKLKLTGHFIIEDTLAGQIQWGANMLHYQYEHIPGIDHLGRNINDVITPKQASSVAHQTGKPRVLSETFGGGGWNTLPLHQKWIADWQFALGINFMNQHLFHYSLRGQRKYDYPPSFFYHQPYWKHYKKISDYFARLSYVLSQGKFHADALVIHPIGSAWCVTSPRDASRVNELNETFVKLTENLLSRHVSFDFGDEMLMEKLAGVKGKTINVGKMSYSAVIIPPSVSLRKSTVKLLQAFSKNGGKIIAVKPLPQFVDGKAEKISLQWKTHDTVNLSENAWKELTDLRITDETGSELTSLYMHHRALGKSHLYFIANTNTDKSYKAVLHFKNAKSGAAQLWDAFTGQTRVIPLSGQNTAAKTLPLFFAPAASFVILLTPESKKAAVTPAVKFARETSIDDGWKLVSQEENALSLDTLSYRVGNDDDYTKKLPFFFAQVAAEKKNEPVPVFLRYSFVSDVEPQKLKTLDLIVENPEKYQIFINGAPVSNKSAGTWKDIAFHRVPIKQFAKQGENTIELHATFMPPKKPGTLIFEKEGMDIAPVYLIGDFHVYEQKITKKKKQFALAPQMKITSLSNLVIRGLPFYAGRLVFSKTFPVNKKKNEKILLSFDGVNAASLSVSVNGHDASVFLWPPYEMDITPRVRTGSNKITLEITNTLRNLLGPHHHPAKEPLMTGPQDFASAFLWTDDYYFVPFGISGITLKFFTP